MQKLVRIPSKSPKKSTNLKKMFFAGVYFLRIIFKISSYRFYIFVKIFEIRQNFWKTLNFIKLFKLPYNFFKTLCIFPECHRKLLSFQVIFHQKYNKFCQLFPQISVNITQKFYLLQLFPQISVNITQKFYLLFPQISVKFTQIFFTISPKFRENIPPLSTVPLLQEFFSHKYLKLTQKFYQLFP